LREDGAVSFPLVAATIAAFRYTTYTPSVIFKIIAVLLLIISTVVISPQLLLSVA